MPGKRKPPQLPDGAKPAKRASRRLTPEETRIWKEANRLTEKFDADTVEEVQEAPPTPEEKRVTPPRKPAGPAKPRRSELPPLTPGDLSVMDKRTAERFAAGQMKKQGKLDLHGHTQEEAYEALLAFIHHHVAKESRMLLVITGQGGRKQGAGLLKERVPAWLAAPPLRKHVLAVKPAQQKDGGAGALYVLLRRQRGTQK